MTPTERRLNAQGCYDLAIAEMRRGRQRDSRQLVLRYDIAGIGVPIIVGAFVLLLTIPLGLLMRALALGRPVEAAAALGAILLLLLGLVTGPLYRAGRERRP